MMTSRRCSDRPKAHVGAVVDRKICEEMEHIHMQEIESAKSEYRVESDWSNTIESCSAKVSDTTGKDRVNIQQ
jgi:hypothetical protein